MNIPGNAVVKDSGGNLLTESNGSYSVASGNESITLSSSTPIVVDEIAASVSSNDTGDTATTTLAGSLDDIIVYDAGDSVDGGAGIDTLELSGNLVLDFSDENMASIENIEKIDLSIGDHEISLSLSDVLDMTDPAHQLVITGDSSDTLHFSNDLAGSGWSQTNSTSNGDGTTTYNYSDGNDSLTLTVDENIQNTGL